MRTLHRRWTAAGEARARKNIVSLSVALEAYEERTGQEPPKSLYEATPVDVAALLRMFDELGQHGAEAGWLLARHFEADPDEIARVCVLERAHEQWTDGELLALLEQLRPLLDCSPMMALQGMHTEIVTTRHIARGVLRTKVWAMMDAVSVIMVGSKRVEVPDNAARWKAVRELLRQHAGWTNKGFAEDVQAEIEAVERHGPQLPEKRVEH